LSPIEAEVLRLLIVEGEMYGLELVGASQAIKRGTVYVTLGRMADKGFVESREVKPQHEPGMPRRLYRATAFGARMFNAWEAAQAIMRGALA
jgi:DNA-binding PadR family transcriptional regulator